MAHRLMALPAPAPHPLWRTAAFRHPGDPVGVTLATAEARADAGFRVHIAEASGLGVVAGVLAAQLCLEWLRRAETADLAALNRHFQQQPAGDDAMLAAGTLHFLADGRSWCGSFAGISAPILIGADGRVEALHGTGPFLGLTETTFPILRGRLGPGDRLIVLAGPGAGGRATELIEIMTNSPRTDLPESVDRLGHALAARLEPGFGLTLIGVEPND